jgi:hypothetical protein
MRSSPERLRRIAAVRAMPGHRLHVRWSDGPEAEVNLEPLLQRRAFCALTDEHVFAQAQVGDWGHSVAWPSGVEIGADSLWLETLSATGREDARAFLDWRSRHALSLTDAANALGLSRRMVAYYSSGEKAVPRHVLLACLGWEVAPDPARAEAAPELEGRGVVPA